MSRLLSAGFSKLFKSAVYRICFAIAVLYPVFQATVRFADYLKYPELNTEPIDAYTMMDMVFLWLILAAFVALFIGREYSDGTIRNKLIIGHSRLSVYVSNFLVTYIGSVILHLVFFSVMFVLLKIFSLPMSLDLSDFLAVNGVAFIIIAAYIALFTMVAMIVTNKSTSAVATLIVAFVLFMLGMVVYSTLAEIRSIEAQDEVVIYYDGDDLDQAVNMQKNSNSEEIDPLADMQGFQKIFFRISYDCLPSSQSMRMMDYTVMRSGYRQSLKSGNLMEQEAYPLSDIAVKFILYDLLIILASTVVGIFIFTRKDLN